MGLAMDDLELKAASFEIGRNAEVAEVPKSPCHAFGDLKDAVNRFHCCISEAGAGAGANVG
jgi:hypothetical protein